MVLLVSLPLVSSRRELTLDSKLATDWRTADTSALGETVRLWPTFKKCFPTTATELLFEQQYTSGFREHYEKKIMDDTNPPKEIPGSYQLHYKSSAFKMTADMHHFKVGPVSNLTLPETVTLADIDGGGGKSFLGGDGTLISSSDLTFKGQLHNKLHVVASLCLWPKGWIFGSDDHCSKWVSGCHLDANVTVHVSGSLQFKAKECLDASLANVQTCIADLRQCMYADVTEGSAVVKTLETHIDDISGSELCELTGVTRSWLNKFLQESEPQMVDFLNQELGKIFVETFNKLLREEQIKPFKQHP